MNDIEVVLDDGTSTPLTSAELKLSDKAIAEDIGSKLLYEFEADFLIKPLELVKVKIQDMEQDPDYYKTLTDKQGNIVGKKRRGGMTSDDTLPEGFKRVEREVIAIFQHGIILKRPKLDVHPDLNVGDIVVYAHQMAKPFDLFKDSSLLPPHAIVGTFLGSAVDINFSE